MVLKKTAPGWHRALALTLAVVFTFLSSSVISAAQEESEEMFNLGIVAVVCDIQAPGNITVQEEGCRPAEGAVFTVSVDMENGEGIGSCTAKVADVPNPITAGCSIPIPFGASVSVNQDPRTVPAGYEIVKNAQKYTAPDGPESGDVGGVIFVNLLQTDQPDGGATGGSDASTPAVIQLPKTGTGAGDGTSTPGIAVSAAMLVVVTSAGVISYWRKTRAA